MSGVPNKRLKVPARADYGMNLFSANTRSSTTCRGIASLLGVLVFATPGLGAAQDTPETVGGFPYRVFSDSEAIARWILRYDRVAWVTSDSVLAAPESIRSRLGQEWFCYVEGGLWHAVYGRYSPDSDRYQVVLHYQSSGNLQFRSTALSFDTVSLLPLARALFRARSTLPDSLIRTGVAFNQYVRRLSDSTIDIWYLPGQQRNGLIVWGAEIRQVYTSDGRMLLKSAIGGNGLRGIYPDTAKELAIDEREHDVPSVGSIFFLLSYRRAFRHIDVWTSRFLSTLAQGDSGQLVWIHAVRGGPSKN